MMRRIHFAKWVTIFFMILHQILPFNSVFSICEFNLVNNGKMYNFNLASPTSKFPHGVLSEDGFYRVAVNDTIVWFQLCDGMIFNHDPPMCVDCLDCGGPSHCGMGCSALVADKIEGYDVCTAIGLVPSTNISIIDIKNPDRGVTVKMSKSGTKVKCSLSVSVICTTDGIQVPQILEKIGPCEYATSLRHPSGCAKIIHVDRRGWGFFGTFIIIILCLFGGYLLAGIVYRYYVLKVRGVDVIPNLEFWLSLPHKIQSLFASLVRKFKGPSRGHRDSYSPVNF
ncbi:uncharacterized protein LOC120081502 [Benincasa hispida]|uniref:uncharacterized protein LOC120081502 n=1 Tax=Benincasa hispida TaxID=102211 RepID=UPI0018FFC551|nr:uncharacterized protein LOC120081502 [Benincasa hispida]XP_038892377.1 uncharacterized protein LOC120081502 [Benincasa hispida]